MTPKYLAFLLTFAALTANVTAQTYTASRTVSGNVYYYACLREAIEAAAGTSIDSPDEITVLSDITLDEPIIIDTAKHIRLLADGGRTIQRGSGNLEYPLFWLTGETATLTLGKPGMNGELIIDGGYLSTPSIEAHTPLIAVNGQDSKLVMYDNVTLQNNYNIGAGTGISLYQNGAGVFLRTADDNTEHQAEFVMKGGTIRGNINNTQNVINCGGGVFISGFALFTMEGGAIMNNTAYRAGGGFHTGSRGSFKKTGGIIYGADAPAGYRNTALNGNGSPKVYGHAVYVALIESPAMQFRDKTVRENDPLTYTGSSKENGVFGKGEKWSAPKEPSSYLLIILPLALLSAFLALFFIIRKKTEKHQLTPLTPAEIDINLSPREKEIFSSIINGISPKEIAYNLKVSYHTVVFHRRNLYRKLGINSLQELFAKYTAPSAGKAP
jgi:DNA-binding CsgD family transcriptional regulator